MAKTAGQRAPWSNAMGDAERQEHRTCQKEHREHWVVLQRKCNFSAFNGYRRTRSAYSSVECQAPGCGRVWRTKAAYVDGLPDA